MMAALRCLSAVRTRSALLRLYPTCSVPSLEIQQVHQMNTGLALKEQVCPDD